ncbi:hypothetical protein Taro_042682, partial [Colocasia esculenta]|nr:hypothetical protein [Colocasia esculenta]
TWIFASPAIGTAREAAIRNWHFDLVGTRSHSEIFGPEPNFLSESVHKHRRYSHPFRFIPTPSVKELDITFRPGIRIAYVTTIRNRTPRWSTGRWFHGIPFWGQNSTAERMYWYTDCRTPWVGCGFLLARQSEWPARPQFGISTSTRSAQGRIRRLPV